MKEAEGVKVYLLGQRTYERGTHTERTYKHPESEGLCKHDSENLFLRNAREEREGNY